MVHIHTFFPLLSPSILYAAKRCGVKVVATLHDTRFICPCASSLRKGKLCNKCGDGKYLRMVKYACFKESKMQSFIVACIFKYHKIRKTFYKQIDRYICLNDNQINLLEQIGYDSNKIVKKYNFVPDNDVKPTKGGYEIPDRYVVFYGRIGEEKGIRVLYELWNRISDIPLVVMGGGPLEDEFRNWAVCFNNRILDGIIGIGIGNCNIGGGTSTFAELFQYTNYSWFQSSYIFAETGVIGLVLYILTFLSIYIKTGNKQEYSFIVKIMVVLSLLLVIYDEVLKTEGAFLVYFMLSLGLVSIEKKDELV